MFLADLFILGSYFYQFHGSRVTIPASFISWVVAPQTSGSSFYVLFVLTTVFIYCFLGCRKAYMIKQVFVVHCFLPNLLHIFSPTMFLGGLRCTWKCGVGDQRAMV